MSNEKQRDPKQRPAFEGCPFEWVDQSFFGDDWNGLRYIAWLNRPSPKLDWGAANRDFVRRKG